MPVKFKWKKYYEPTPKNIRRLADSILAATTFGSGYAMMMEKPLVGYTIIALGVLAKFASNFFMDEPDESPTDATPE